MTPYTRMNHHTLNLHPAASRLRGHLRFRCLIAGPLFALCLLSRVHGQEPAAVTPPESSVTVGISSTISDLVLPGSELEAVPLDDPDSPLVVRVVSVFPHGSAMRYGLSWYALEPGTYDLREALRRKDGSPTDDLPAIEVVVETVLPPGQVLPNALSKQPLPKLGWYRTALIVGSITWVFGLSWILFFKRKKLAEHQDGSSMDQPTAADHLRPLVKKASQGELDTAEQARLERLLLLHWKKEAGLDSQSTADSIAALRKIPEAAPLLTAVEEWLHNPDADTEIDIEELLKPYK